MATLTRRERSRAPTGDREAAHRFHQPGLCLTTMGQIAEAAGVAVQTVYFVIHTKAALLARAIDFAVIGEGDAATTGRAAVVSRHGEAPEIDEALRHW